MRRKDFVTPRDRLALSLNETCNATGIGMMGIRRMIKEGKLPIRRLGRRIYIRVEDIDVFLKRLPGGFNETPAHLLAGRKLFGRNKADDEPKA